MFSLPKMDLGTVDPADELLITYIINSKVGIVKNEIYAFMPNIEIESIPAGPRSFCIPRVALDALIEAQATAYEICTYLVLAHFTDVSGQFSSASLHAVNRYTGANKTKGGPVDRAIERLKTIHAKRKELVSNGRSGKSHQTVESSVDLGPILLNRSSWQTEKQVPLPDGPVERAKILHILPDFGEPFEQRIWFGGNLITGLGGFDQPLKNLKNAGDVAARLLLLMYAENDMETWGGVRPSTAHRDGGPWNRYEPVSEDSRLRGGVRLIRCKEAGQIGPGKMFSKAWRSPSPSDWWKQHSEAGEPVWAALRALKSSGLIYELVMVLNRNAVKSHFSSGTEYGDIPDDAEPLYELDCRSQHGYKPAGEEGIGGLIARTAGDLGHPVTTVGGVFDGTYGAFLLDGHGAMIAGLYRLRFRVSNRNNAGVTNAWARIHQNQRDALALLNRVRLANGLRTEVNTDGGGSKPRKRAGPQTAEV